MGSRPRPSERRRGSPCPRPARAAAWHGTPPSLRARTRGNPAPVAGPSGTRLHLEARRRNRPLEAHLGAQALHRRVQAATDFPVELVALVEERDLAGGAVDDLVDLLAALDGAARLA